MAPKEKPPASGIDDATGRIYAAHELFAETVSLFHRLKVVTEEIHHFGELSGGMRGVLRNLDAAPATVPQLARMRPVSRQHIQLIVNDLKDKELVELVDNPAHQRSRLVQLTAAGTRYLKAMNRKEGELLAELGIDIPAADMERAARTLRAVRELFEGERWRRVVAD